MSTDLPQPIREAVHQLAAYVSQSGYAEVIITRTGNALFKQSSSIEKPTLRKQLGIVGIIGAVWSLAIFVASWAILGVSVFTSSLKLDTGWAFVLIGAPWLLMLVTLASVLEPKETRTTSSTIAVFTTFVFVGLALLSKSAMLSTLFYAMSISCFIFGYGLERLQSLIRPNKVANSK
ncbi:hypothetical protein ANAEL_02780 [Anaerolineales bacterium]|nr:hypothetical protein ANAEL_02780 [Anaerolineales bacterium]